MINITPEEIKVFSKYIHTLCGIVLDETKAYLISSRLSSIVEECRCKSFSELYYKLKYDANAQSVRDKVVDAITTNETMFFRDVHPFDCLKFKVIPDLIDKKARRGKNSSEINIWCAAASTGQEIYSIAIAVSELFGADIRNYNIKILGTDISEDALKKAEKATYTKFEIGRGVEQPILQKYFTNAGGSWQINDNLRSMASFRKLNLMEPFDVKLQKFDIVFCRNVAIYFNLEDKRKLYQGIFDVLDQDGYLFIGSSETLLGICDKFQHQTHVRTTFYIK
ncbi:CheR family methyltransferase [Candidatus Auribacterota bacterium]